MNIGIDIDGVLTDIESFQLKYGEKYFKKNFNKEVINENGFDIKDIFECSDKERMSFWKKYLLYYSMCVPARNGFSELTEKLTLEGNRVYIITKRVFADKDNFLGKIMRIIVKEWLKSNKIIYDDIVFCGDTKLDAIKKYNIDVMIEDNPENVNEILPFSNAIIIPAKYNSNYNYKYYTKNPEEIYSIIQKIKFNKKVESNDLTGKASVDMPWIDNYYNYKQKNLNFPEKTIYEYMYDKNKDNLSNPALLYFGNTYTFKQFFDMIDICSKSMKANGVKEGDIVTICMPNTPEGVIAFYATNKIGAIANMIHPLSGEEEIKNYLNEAKSKLLIMIDICYDKVNNIIENTSVEKTVIVSPNDSMPLPLSVGYDIINIKKKNDINYGNKYIKWKDFMNKGKTISDKIQHPFKKNELAVLLHTGGTTGTPKGVMISNENFNINVEQLSCTIPSYKKGDSLLAITPIFHGFGLANCVHTALCVNMSVNLLPQYDAQVFTTTLLRDKPNLILGVPTLWDAMLKNDKLKNKELSFLKVLISGGDQLPIELENNMNEFLIQHKAPNNIFKGYGMTESLAASTFTSLNANPISSIGIPLPGNNMKIVELGTTNEVGYGKLGEICINGPTQMLGYYSNEKETNEILKIHSDGKKWLHTGDIGYITEDGIVYYVQRSKRIIISSGYNIYPVQIEEVIKENINVKECIVVAKPHEKKVNVAKAYVVLKDNSESIDKVEEEIRNICKQKLSRFSWPYEYVFKKELPKTLLGKIDYQLLENETIDEYYSKPKVLKK